MIVSSQIIKECTDPEMSDVKDTLDSVDLSHAFHEEAFHPLPKENPTLSEEHSEPSNEGEKDHSNDSHVMATEDSGLFKSCGNGTVEDQNVETKVATCVTLVGANFIVRCSVFSYSNLAYA